MRLYRGILALLILGVYGMLLLHDFIPHTHRAHQPDVHATTALHHKHGGDHHSPNSHHHHQQKERDEESPESSDDKPMRDLLIQPHSHPGYDGHQHSLVHGPFPKDKKITVIASIQYGTRDSWEIPNGLEYSDFWQLKSSPPPFDSPLLPGQGLRAPPALG